MYKFVLIYKFENGFQAGQSRLEFPSLQLGQGNFLPEGIILKIWKKYYYSLGYRNNQGSRINLLRKKGLRLYRLQIRQNLSTNFLMKFKDSILFYFNLIFAFFNFPSLSISLIQAST